MADVRIDMEKLNEDLERVRREVDAAQAQVDEAQTRFAQAQTRLRDLTEFVDQVRTYAVAAPQGLGTSSIPEGEMAQMTGKAAVTRLVASRPGETMTVKAIVEALRKMGFTGTPNAVTVALANLRQEGQVTSVKRGVYQFPSPTSEVEASEESA